MRGGLDETLARLARREEALRRRAADQGGAADGEAAAPPAAPDGVARARARVRTSHSEPLADGRGEARNAGPGWGDARRAGEPRDPVAEVADAVRRVVVGHPGMAVTIRIEHGRKAYPLRIAWTGTGVTVGAEKPAVPPPAAGPAASGPASGRTPPAWTPDQEGLGADPAARLTELLRNDPSLLDDGSGG
ncbi:hypothetical protein AB0L34_01090 [Micromonospora sp. NPDC052213]|uniref:hypothetical protein n=1 Tax=Micromonospora sp. NPDC052213 TaxID=3155812 RepID=UPI0034356516